MGTEINQEQNTSLRTDQHVTSALGATAMPVSESTVVQPQAAVTQVSQSAVSITPTTLLQPSPQATPVQIANPQFTAVNDLSRYEQQTKIKKGLVALVISSFIAVLSMSLAYVPFVAHASSNMPVITAYGGAAVIALITALIIAVPAYKKNTYPNIAGLVGLVIDIIVMITMINALLLFLTTGT